MTEAQYKATVDRNEKLLDDQVQAAVRYATTEGMLSYNQVIGVLESIKISLYAEAVEEAEREDE